MWDIKWVGPHWHVFLPVYYLNHVGYKAISFDELMDILNAYYLNHVGYKVGSIGLFYLEGGWYYLNHVGYKV